MSSIADYTTNEIMTVAAARLLRNGAVCFVGIGLPSTAANLARLTHAPDIVLIYESGPIGAKPPVLPLSIGDGNLAETADTRGGSGHLGPARHHQIGIPVLDGAHTQPDCVRRGGAGRHHAKIRTS